MSDDSSDATSAKPNPMPLIAGLGVSSVAAAGGFTVLTSRQANADRELDQKLLSLDALLMEERAKPAVTFAAIRGRVAEIGEPFLNNAEVLFQRLTSAAQLPSSVERLTMLAEGLRPCLGVAGVAVTVSAAGTLGVGTWAGLGGHRPNGEQKPFAEKFRDADSGPISAER